METRKKCNRFEPKVLTPAEQLEIATVNIIRQKTIVINRNIMAKGARLTHYEEGRPVNTSSYSARKYYA